MKRNWIIVGGLFLVLGIGGYFAYQLKKLKDYKVKLVGRKVKVLTLDRVIIDLVLEVENPSNIDIIVNSYDLDLSVNGNFVSKVKNNIDQLIKAKNKSSFIVILDFVPRNVLKQAFNINFIKDLATNKSNITIGLNGSISIMNGLKNIPINIEERLSSL